MNENYTRLIKLLKELFQIDRPDLDFGIYRIMNQKRDEITSFLDKDLLPQVQEAFAQHNDEGHKETKKELDRLITALKKAEIDPNQSPKVKELQKKLGEATNAPELENEVYSHLFNFFRRYYKDGDFLSLRRYKKDVYAIPYEGEEVKLHWANADQYYIKSSENFKDYTFKLGEFSEDANNDNRKTIHFKLVEADTELANNKAQEGKERRFVLSEQQSFVEKNDELFIHFEYKQLSKKQSQKKLNEATTKAILNNEKLSHWALSLAKNENGISTLEKHLNSYTARNTFDYFLHKNLGGFLQRELDFYIKNEIMHLDDIEEEHAIKVELYLNQIKVFRKIARKIIQFLAQTENFQKKLWVKKKFVVQTDYCITLDRIPERLYSDICLNGAQRDEWVRLFAINDINEDLTTEGFSVPLTTRFLEQNTGLVLDTRFFGQKIKNSIVASIDHQEIEGHLIKSDNFHALQHVNALYAGKVDQIYIDPPYNTNSAPILYKNDYKDSSWLSLMESRLSLAQNLLTPNGVFTIAIDDAELANLSKLIEQTFPNTRMTKVTVVHNPKGSITKDFNRTHEYAIFITNEASKKCITREMQENTTPRKMRRWGENSNRIERRLSFYPIYVKDNQIIRIGTVPDDDFHPSAKNEILPDGSIAIWPIDQNGVERRWNFGLDSIKKNLNRIIVIERNEELDLFLTHEESVPKTVWWGGEFDAGTYGNTLLINMLGEKRFDFPKSINLVKKCLELGSPQDSSLVVDFFAGSGTTAHACILRNRESAKNTKYVLVEMGKHFETVVKPRVLKAIYSENWSSGKPIGRNSISHAFKYTNLESYEDSLNNLCFKKSTEQTKLLISKQSLKEEYLLSYFMETETKESPSLLNIEKFNDPWNYTMKIATGSAGETKVHPVDLIETFNYLIGLTIHRHDFVKKIEVIEGIMPNGDSALIIWRNTNEVTNDQLNNFFQKQDFNPRDSEFDIIYVNGDNNLENLRREDETWKVRLIEEDFHRLMFDVEDV